MLALPKVGTTLALPSCDAPLLPPPPTQPAFWSVPSSHAPLPQAFSWLSHKPLLALLDSRLGGGAPTVTSRPSPVRSHSLPIPTSATRRGRAAGGARSQDAATPRPRPCRAGRRGGRAGCPARRGGRRARRPGPDGRRAVRPARRGGRGTGERPAPARRRGGAAARRGGRAGGRAGSRRGDGPPAATRRPGRTSLRRPRPRTRLARRPPARARRSWRTRPRAPGALPVAGVPSPHSSPRARGARGGRRLFVARARARRPIPPHARLSASKLQKNLCPGLSVPLFNF